MSTIGAVRTRTRWRHAVATVTAGVASFCAGAVFANSAPGILDVVHPQAEVKIGSYRDRLDFLSRADGTIPLAPDTYRVYGIQLRKIDNRQNTWVLHGSDITGNLRNIEIRSGETTRIPLGAPLTIKAMVRPATRGTDIMISYSIIGQANEDYGLAATRNGKIAKPPRFQIVMEDGRVVERGRFTYACAGNAWHWWKVPKNLSGRFQVILEPELGPFEWNSDTTWHDLTP